MPPARTPDNLASDISNIKTHLSKIDERSLPVSWKWVVATASIISTIVIGVVVYYVNSVVPMQIAKEVNPIQVQVNGLTHSGNNPSAEISAVNRRLEEGLEKLNDRINKLYERLANSPATLRSSLERARPKKQEEANSGYPVMRELLEHAKQKRVVLKPEELKRLALPLLDVKYSDRNAGGEAWATVKEFAAFRTHTNSLLFGEPKPEGGATENYFNGGVQNLGSRSEWKDTVFVNCQINIEGAQASLILENVRFINCDFRPLDETNAAMALVTAVLSSDGPAVSAPLLDHRLPAGKTGS